MRNSAAYPRRAARPHLQLHDSSCTKAAARQQLHDSRCTETSVFQKFPTIPTVFIFPTARGQIRGRINGAHRVATGQCVETKPASAYSCLDPNPVSAAQPAPPRARPVRVPCVGGAGRGGAARDSAGQSGAARGAGDSAGLTQQYRATSVITQGAAISTVGADGRGGGGGGEGMG